MKKFNSNYILIGVFILAVIGLIIILNSRESNNYKKRKYTIVSNVSTFFTVEGCVNRYLNSLSKGNVDELMILVDENYIEKNNLDKNNILDNLNKKEGHYSFSARKMYSEKNTNGATYYVYGLLQEERLDTIDYGEDYYIIVRIQNDQYYSVEPLDKNVFEEVSQ